MPSEELVNEIIKLIDVVKAAVEIHLLDSANNIDAIDFANTDALKTIVSGILILHLFKVTKVELLELF